MAKTKSEPKSTDRTFVFSTKVIDKMMAEVDEGRVLRRYESPWLKNITGVRKPNVPWAWTQEELVEYGRCADNVSYFAENYCKIKLEDGTYGKMDIRDYQQEIIDLYTNNKYGILMASRQSGKTVSAAIVILHYVTFNSDKGVMIVANKAKTVIEIIDKIKSIYLSLPYWLKPGVTNWSARTLNFSNGCKIKSEARTKEPSIGFTIDFLYIDEFAHIPKNIINSFYRAVVPTVSSIENSKIIITSTPNGFNMFHELWEGANRPKGDPKKNPYKALKVLWTQIPGRQDTKFYPNWDDLDRFNITRGTIEQLMADNGVKRVASAKEANRCSIVDEDSYYWKREQTPDNRMVDVLCIGKTDRMDLTTVPSLELKLHNGTIKKLLELGDVSNWEQSETLLIGGAENFNQEYNLHFLAGSKRLLDPVVMNAVVDSRTPYEFIDLAPLHRLWFECKELEWSTVLPFDVNPTTLKTRNCLVTVDIGEGGGGDNSVIQIFDIRPKSKEELLQTIVKSVHDCFKLHQVGRYAYNRISIDELAHLLYVIVYELLDPEKVRVTIESNTYGGELMSKMQQVFNGVNQFGSYPFLRFKHKIDDEKVKIGIKVTPGNKKQMVLAFKEKIKFRDVVISDPMTTNELSNFIKITRSTGSETYAAESGHDDTVMACVHAASSWTTNTMKTVVLSLYNAMTSVDRMDIDAAMSVSKFCENNGSFQTMRNAIRNAAAIKRSAGVGKTYSGRFVRRK